MRHDTNDNKYAFLMVEFDMPDFVRELQSKINPEELYTVEDSDDYGLEQSTHVTLVPCLSNDVDLIKLKGFLGSIDDYGIVLTNISKFECDEYDVLKCAVNSPKFMKVNKDVVDNFDTYSEYKEYQPHLTIAYMKHGMADKYLMDILPKLIQLTPIDFHLSYYDKNGNEQHKHF